MSFVSWAIYLMDLHHVNAKRYLQYTFFATVLITQEKNPWDDLSAATPIVSAFILLFLSFAIRRRVPTYDYVELRRGTLLLCFAVACFTKGLDDDHDPFRFFHGCWHGFVGAAAFFNFRVVITAHKTSHLPTKRI
jgi:predicted membrane channel-forming protein YqfA (hemolysin III family)